MTWADRHTAHVGGGRAPIEIEDDRIYLAMSLRNVGSGVAVLQASHVELERRPGEDARSRRRRASGGRAAISTSRAASASDKPRFAPRRRPVHGPPVRDRGTSPFLIDVLYSNDEGDQRAVTQFVVNPLGGVGSQWLCAVGRHRNLDRPNPR